jgi:hypothetical protein
MAYRASLFVRSSIYSYLKRKGAGEDAGVKNEEEER